MKMSRKRERKSEKAEESLCQETEEKMMGYRKRRDKESLC